VRAHIAKRVSICTVVPVKQVNYFGTSKASKLRSKAQVRGASSDAPGGAAARAGLVREV
jgi:hypothetical protein